MKNPLKPLLLLLPLLAIAAVATTCYLVGYLFHALFKPSPRSRSKP